ncbi:DUF2163 domain-containing protein [Roseobacteraceae bacterium S113]
MVAVPSLSEHLNTGLTTMCRAWAITRKDGESFGFTDHDRDLSFEDIGFRADTGLTALALQQSTGLSVDNTEALGALSDASLSENDILAGRFDGARVRGWLVNWRNLEERELVFNGTIGEITRVDGAFRAEVRGLAEALNRPMGRVVQKSCSAVLGDGRCGFDVNQLGYSFTGDVVAIDGRASFIVDTQGGFADGWFKQGALRVKGGEAQGLRGVVKRDTVLEDGNQRRVELWEPLRQSLAVGDEITLIAGCDKRADTCRFKFDNLLNFRGFPDVPEDDWIVAPAPVVQNTSGGSRR